MFAQKRTNVSRILRGGALGPFDFYRHELPAEFNDVVHFGAVCRPEVV